MRNPGTTYNLNDPELNTETITARLVGIKTAHGKNFKEPKTILIYLGELPENRPVDRILAHYATEAWAKLIGYEVREVNSRQAADLTFKVLPHDDELLDGAAGMARGNEIWISDAQDGESAPNTLLEIYLHEIGHILGLWHPHEYLNAAGEVIIDYLPQDSVLVTVMSYVHDIENTLIPATPNASLMPGILDIEAIQALYDITAATRPDVNPDDTRYGVDENMAQQRESGDPLAYEQELWYKFTRPGEFPSTHDNSPRVIIYDTGGIDTLDLSNEGPGNPGKVYAAREYGTEVTEVITTSQNVNLNPGWSSNVYGRQANLVIANDTIIENFIAGHGNDLVTGNQADNRLEGRNGNDVLDGGPGNDTLEGGEGNDRLKGGVGDDTLQGGNGNDRLQGGEGTDTLSGGEGTDLIDYNEAASGLKIRLHANQADLEEATGDRFAAWIEIGWTDAEGMPQTTRLPDIEGIIGSNHEDTLAGDRRNNVLYGLNGNDKLYGGPGGGNDRLSGGNGEDSLFGGIGHDRLDGGPGDDTLAGGAGNDRLVGGPGQDKLSGGAGADTASYEASPEGVTVRLHSDQLVNGTAEGDSFTNKETVTWTDETGTTQQEELPDVENLAGSPYNDTLAGDRRDNVLDGLDGNDRLYGGPGGGDDRLLGSAGNDALYGGQGNDSLDGGPGNDTLSGGPGNDNINGGAGNDRLTGGAGADVFVFDRGNYEDTVTDFSLAEDRIDLRAFELSSIEDLAFLDENQVYQLDAFLLGGVFVFFENLTGGLTEDHFIL